ncbi:MAG: hypothetical protein AMS27_01925 [Bacteroides sp. SM23_62_1]|nr:MAG: hypothetical protein AMS27_01925 [Bacteroides sp. SM23_62_1]
MAREDYISLGMVVKTRGISGGLVIRSKSKIPKVKAKWEIVWIEIDGLLVPFFIASCTHVKDNEILIDLEDIDLPEQAAKLTDKQAFIHKSDILHTADKYSTETILGYMVIDMRYGKIGKITGIDEIPGNSLFRVEYGKQEILIPVQQDLIHEINEKTRCIMVDLPEGLLEI